MVHSMNLLQKDFISILSKAALGFKSSIWRIIELNKDSGKKYAEKSECGAREWPQYPQDFNK